MASSCWTGARLALLRSSPLPESSPSVSKSPAPAFRERGFLRFFVPWLVALSLPIPGSAHDLWMIPGKFRLDMGESTRIFINNGDVFPEAHSLLAEQRVAGLWLHGQGEPTPVTERRVDGRSLTFDFEASKPGIYVLALSTRPRRVRLKAADFNDYLENEGLPRAFELRNELGEAEQATVERYTKWAKAYIAVAGGEVEDPPWAEPVGHRFEIVPISNPTRVEAEDELSFRVLFDGEPLEGTVVVGARAGGPEKEIEAVTDEDGVVNVSVSSSGRWYLRAIHMTRPEEDPEVQWESFWCTLTFEAAARVGSPEEVVGE